MTSKVTEQTDIGEIRESIVYTYGLQNRLERVTVTPYTGGVADTTVGLTEYKYNLQGIRVSKHTWSETSGVGNGDDVYTDYLIDSYNHTGYAQVLEETTDDGTNLTRTQYTIGDDVISQTESTYSTSWSAGQTQYLLYDGHGSTRQLLNADLTIAETYSYDGYGVMLGSDTDSKPADNAATSLLYSGEQYDSNLSQYYLRARYYNQNNGRFNRMDDFAGNMQDPQSLHKYAYCHANPINSIDPTGMITLGGLNISMCIRAIMTSISTYATAAYVWTATHMALITSVSYYAMWTFIAASLWVGLESQDYVPSIRVYRQWTVGRAIQVVSGFAFFLGLMIINTVPDLEMGRLARETQMRAYELRQAMGKANRFGTTMAVGVAENPSGARMTLIATSETSSQGLYLRPGVALRSNEILVSGTGHAEQRIVSFAQQQGLRLLTVGATRPVCAEVCVPNIAPTGADIATPIKGEHLMK